MSHDVYPVLGAPGVFLDISNVDGSAVLRTTTEMDALFNPNWREWLHEPVSPAKARRAVRAAE